MFMFMFMYESGKHRGGLRAVVALPSAKIATHSMLRVLGTLVLALSSVQAFAPPACVLRVPMVVRCQRRSLASAARDAESRRKMAIFDACRRCESNQQSVSQLHTVDSATPHTDRSCAQSAAPRGTPTPLGPLLQHWLRRWRRRCGKGRAITREETEELRSVGGRRADRYGEITPKGFASLGQQLRLHPHPYPYAYPFPYPYP